MTYQVLARKWRPKNFASLAGQEHVVRALVNALEQQRLHHAYLFTGTRGVGKTTIARIIAKCLNCETGITATPCGECSACTSIDSGRFMDLLEVDAASRTKVEDTRELLENVQYAPTSGRFKIYLIDEVHMLSTHSFNALLKTLEEPPPHVKFLLATTDPQKLPITILSRCLQFNLKRMPAALIAEHLTSMLAEEKIEAEPAALRRLGQAADGSMRDAQSLLDQAIAFGNGVVSLADVQSMLGDIPHEHVCEILEALAANDADGLLIIVEKLAETISDFGSVLAQLIDGFHQIAKLQVAPAAVDSEDMDAERLQKLATAMPKEDVQLFYQIALLGRRDLPLAFDPKSGFEMVLLRMLAFQPAPSEASPAGGKAVKFTRDSKPASIQSKNDPLQKTTQQADHEVTPEKASVSLLAASEVQEDNSESKTPVANLNWHELLERTRLKGLTQQLAAHCELIERKGNLFQLRIADTHANLLSDTVENRLREGLSTTLKEPIKLEFVRGDTESETPAERGMRLGDERQERAQTAISNDPFVQSLQDTFGAKVVPNSVRPTD